MREYVQEAMLANAQRNVSPHETYRDGLTDEELVNVIEAMAGGYWKAAENQLKTLLRTKRTSLVAWSLLAEVLMNQKNFTEVENTVLPEMRFVAGAAGSAWIDMTEGCFSLRQEKPNFRKAHEHFMCAFKSNPDIEQAQNMLIQTALLLGDQTLMETDCTMILAHSRQHPMANAVLGSLRLNQNRLEEAEKVLNVSIATRPSAPAFNDLGETLRRLGRLPDAERMTRRALLLNPSFYQAWDTLALVLTDQGRFAEAFDAHRSALRFCQTDIRLFLNAAKLEQLRGDYTTARALLQQASPLMVHASSAYKEQYDALLKNKPRQ
jgi:Flp pilus assembly protein TadD